MWEWVDGVNWNNGTYYVCYAPSKYADDTPSYREVRVGVALISQKKVLTQAHWKTLMSCSPPRLVVAVSPPITVTLVGVAQVGGCSDAAVVGMMGRYAVCLRLL